MSIDLERMKRLAAVARVRPWVLGAPGDLEAWEIGSGDLVEGCYAPPAVALAREGEWLTLVPCARLGVGGTPSEVAFTLGRTTLVAQGWDARRVPAEALAGCAWQGTLSEDNLAGLRARLAEGCAEEARLVREDVGAALAIVGYRRAVGWPWQLAFPGLKAEPGRVALGTPEAEADKTWVTRFTAVAPRPLAQAAAPVGMETASEQTLGEIVFRDGKVSCTVRHEPGEGLVALRVCRTDAGGRPLRLEIRVGKTPVPKGAFTLAHQGAACECYVTTEESARGIEIVSGEEAAP